MSLTYETMNLKDLQIAAREKSKQEGKPCTWIAGARKETLVSFLSGAEMPQQAPQATADLAELIAQAVAPLVQNNVNADDVRAIVREELEAMPQQTPRAITLQIADKPAITVDTPHDALIETLDALLVGCHVYLCGPAGSGKTTLAEQAAQALALPFACLSVSGQTPVSALMGYMDANGKYVPTAFRKVYEHGGVFLLDEIDNGNPNVLAVLNSALANGICSFMDCNVRRHENFRLVAGANTYGNGATAQYVGRNPIDGATLDRFIFLTVDYSDAIEQALSRGNAEWLRRVTSYRKAALALGIKAIISPRATDYGVRLIAQGWSVEKAEQACIWKGLAPEVITKIKAQAKV